MSERRKWPKPGETFAPAEYGWQVFDAVEATRELNDAEKRVLLKLMRLAGPKTWVRTTSAWLADALGKSRRRVWSAIAGLENKGYLKRESHGNEGGVYRFIWQAEYERFQQDRPGIVQDSSHLCGFVTGGVTNRHRGCDGGVTGGVTEASHRSKHDRTLITRYRERAHQNGTESVLPEGFDATEAFKRIWDRHPRKTGRYLAEQAFSEALAEALNPAALAAEIERVHAAWCDSEDWRKQGGRFAPELHRWLHERRWLDGPPQAPEEERIIPYRPPWEDEEAEDHA